MSNRKAARYIVRFVVLGTFAGTVAAYGAYAKRTPLNSAEGIAEPQVANRAAKTHRLLVAALSIPSNPVYALASADPDASIGREDVDPVKAAVPKIPEVEVAAPVAPPAEPAVAPPKQIAVAPAAPAHDKPAEKPKRLPPPVAPQASNLLDDGAITGLKGRLRLTSDQVEYWPAVESALRDVARNLHSSAKQAHAGRMNIDVNSPEVQKLIWAAMPLLMRLREDQKSEVRKLARVIGLEQVASQI